MGTNSGTPLNHRAPNHQCETSRIGQPPKPFQKHRHPIWLGFEGTDIWAVLEENPKGNNFKGKQFPRLLPFFVVRVYPKRKTLPRKRKTTSSCFFCGGEVGGGGLPETKAPPGLSPRLLLPFLFRGEGVLHKKETPIVFVCLFLFFWGGFKRKPQRKTTSLEKTRQTSWVLDVDFFCGHKPAPALKDVPGAIHLSSQALERTGPDGQPRWV